MTVKELIKMLQGFDDNLRVVVAGYEGGFNDLSRAEPIELNLNVNDEWYYGPHERPDEGKGDETALLLRRGYGHKPND
jgi:hypothetical protein